MTPIAIGDIVVPSPAHPTTSFLHSNWRQSVVSIDYSATVPIVTCSDGTRVLMTYIMKATDLSPARIFRVGDIVMIAEFYRTGNEEDEEWTVRQEATAGSTMLQISRMDVGQFQLTYRWIHDTSLVFIRSCSTTPTAELICRCPSLLHGHHSDCDFLKKEEIV